MSSQSKILEVPTPSIIDRDFIEDVFSHDEFLKVKTAVASSDQEIAVRLLSIGFEEGRSFSKGKVRYQRFTLDRFDYVSQMAREIMSEHGLDREWQFVFDSARQRAGLCNYTDFTISLSKYIVSYHSIDQSRQVILHEVAHALAGKSAGHGPNWKAVAKSLGYRGEKFTGKEIAEQTARWIGHCKNGHTHYRFKSPRAQLACGYCGSGFNPKHLITWVQRAA